MSAIVEGGGQRTFLSVREGMFAMRIQDSDTAHEYFSKSKVYTSTDSDGNVHTSRQFRFKYLVGVRFKDAKIEDGKFKKELKLVVEKGDEKYEIQMGFDSRAASSFFMVMPNIDPSKSYTISAYERRPKPGEDKKPYSVIYVTETGEDESLQWAYTKDAPNGLPQMVKVKIKGKDTWDNSDQLDFFESNLNNVFVPSIKAAKQDAPFNDADEMPEPPASGGGDDDPDLPF